MLDAAKLGKFGEEHGGNDKTDAMRLVKMVWQCASAR